MEVLGLGPRLRMIVVTNFLTLSALTARALPKYIFNKANKRHKERYSWILSANLRPLRPKATGARVGASATVDREVVASGALRHLVVPYCFCLISSYRDLEVAVRHNLSS